MSDLESTPHLTLSQRFQAGFFGIFLMSFGMPFTLTPLLILPEAFGSGDIVMSIFITCFCIPFLLAGLAVQYFGFASLRVALFPNSARAQQAFNNPVSNNLNERSPQNPSLTHYNAPTSAEQRALKGEEQTLDKSENFWDNVSSNPP